MSKYVIDLNNIYMTGANIYVCEGIEALQFQLYDSATNNFNTTEVIGNSKMSCFTYFNSSFFKSQSLVINSIKGCADNKMSKFFPFLEFIYSFSQCPIQLLFPNTPVNTSNTMNLISTSSINRSNSLTTSTITQTQSLTSSRHDSLTLLFEN